MLVNTRQRSTKEELMDDFDMKGAELRKTLKDIARLNRWLGGNRITLDGVKQLLADHPKDKVYSIVDIGCGNGDMLRELVQWGNKKGYHFFLKGIDANAFTIQEAKNLSSTFPEIEYDKENIFSSSYRQNSFDIVLCTLTLHHFDGQKVKEVLQIISDQAKLGVVINDLQRSSLSFYLFKLVCFFFLPNPMARYDGGISILRGFKKNELMDFAASQTTFLHYIRWKWAFRYQWIMKKRKELI